MIFTRPIRRRVSAAGPITIDDVRDGVPANWVGPANPAAVMLFDSSGTDWYNATDYNVALFEGATFKTGTDGGLDFPQSAYPTTHDYATCSGLDFNRAHATGAWSNLLLFSFLADLSTYTFLARHGASVTDRTGYDANNANFNFLAASPMEFPSIPRTAIPFKAAIGVRYEPSEPFATRCKQYANGVQEPQLNVYIAGLYNWDILGSDTTNNFPFRGTLHAFIRWDYEVTEQEMLDATADPDSLFAAV